MQRGATDFNMNPGNLFIPFLEGFATVREYVFVYFRKYIKYYG
jgi:hypothetical protein